MILSVPHAVMNVCFLLSFLDSPYLSRRMNLGRIPGWHAQEMQLPASCSPVWYLQVKGWLTNCSSCCSCQMGRCVSALPLHWPLSLVPQEYVKLLGKLNRKAVLVWFFLIKKKKVTLFLARIRSLILFTTLHYTWLCSLEEGRCAKGAGPSFSISVDASARGSLVF